MNEDTNRTALSDEQIVEAFRAAGLDLNTTPNGLYTVRGQHAQLLNGARALLAERGSAAPDSDLREFLGKLVRAEWVKWAREQPSPKPSWLQSWDELTEPEREVDRRIGEAIWRFSYVRDAQQPVADSPAPEPVATVVDLGKVEFHSVVPIGTLLYAAPPVVPSSEPRPIEQQIRDALERMEVPGAQNFSAGELVELSNLVRGGCPVVPSSLPPEPEEKQ